MKTATSTFVQTSMAAVRACWRGGSGLALVLCCPLAGGCEPQPGPAAELSGTAAAQAPARAHEEPQRAPAVVFPDGGAEFAHGGACRTSHGTCKAPMHSLLLNAEDGVAVDDVSMTGSQFFALKVIQPGIQQSLPIFRPDHNKGQVAIAVQLTSPPEADYDLFLYQANSCKLLAASNKPTATDRVDFAPDEISIGTEYKLVVEVRFAEGECETDAPFVLNVFTQ